MLFKKLKSYLFIFLISIVLVVYLSFCFIMLDDSELDKLVEEKLEAKANADSKEVSRRIRLWNKLMRLLDSTNATGVCLMGLFLLYGWGIIPHKVIIMYIVSFFYDDILKELNEYAKEITKEERTEWEELLAEIEEAKKQKAMEEAKKENETTN